jgi:dipeptidyl aminopeptidase/acylaminoacyl peptidase
LTDHEGEDGQPSWAPDGNTIVFSSDRDGNLELYLMNVEGSGMERITDDPADDRYPAWSPDGGRIAFMSDREGDINVFTILPDGSGLEQLTSDPGFDGVPSWSPAGHELGDSPWFGKPFCAKDTDGDFMWDEAPATFTTADQVAFIVFPFRNMSNGLMWSHEWDTEGGYDINNVSMWDGGESGFHAAYTFLSSTGPGKITVRLFIGEREIQTVECEILSP